MKNLILMVVLFAVCVHSVPIYPGFPWSPLLIPRPIRVPQLIPYPRLIPYPVYIYVDKSKIPPECADSTDSENVNGVGETTPPYAEVDTTLPESENENGEGEVIPSNTEADAFLAESDVVNGTGDPNAEVDSTLDVRNSIDNSVDQQTYDNDGIYITEISPV